MRKFVPIKEESSKAQTSEKLTIVVISAWSPFSLQQISEDILESPSSHSSPKQQSIVCQFLRNEEK